jgi:hypothetical protein
MLLNAASFTTGKAPKLWMVSLSKTCKPQSLKGAAVLFQSGHSLQICLWLKGSNSSGKLQHNLPVKHMRDKKSSKCVLPVHPGVSSSNSSIMSNKKPYCQMIRFVWLYPSYFDQKVGNFSIFTCWKDDGYASQWRSEDLFVFLHGLVIANQLF